jgi:uncharacterized protein YciI/uncharacterized protein YndB with AHSA1/START domain
VSAAAPIRREIVVDLDAQAAFALFTARIGEWWPLAKLSVFGQGASVAFEGRDLIERLGDEASIWGEVTEWIPGKRLSLTWHPGAPAAAASALTISFSQRADRTVVTLEHSGWEALDDPKSARREYDRGWPMVLERYTQAASPNEEPDAYTWVALMHRPAAAVPPDHSVFDDPRFARHVDFLSAMRAAGYLVAAGPMLDSDGQGMTILRLPGADRLEEAKRLATAEDGSVRDGLFEVSVRPWRVVMSRQL